MCKEKVKVMLLVESNVREIRRGFERAHERACATCKKNWRRKG